MPEVPVERLRKAYDPQELGCTTSAEVEPLETIIGQERAVRALRFGLGIKDPGFNIYAAGLPGTGRTTAVERFLEEIAKDKPVPNDLCYVYNFRDSYRPDALSLPAGRARKFQADTQALVEAAQREVRRAFESDEYAVNREETARGFQRQRNGLFSQLTKRAREHGFGLQSSPLGLVTVPLGDGRPLNDEELQSLSAEERDALTEKRDRVQGEIKATLRQARIVEKEATDALGKLDQEVALYVLGPLIEDVQDGYRECPEVVRYLEQVQEDMLENLSQFSPQQQEEPSTPRMGRETRSLRKYEANVLVDNSDLDGAPVITELNPTYNNLFGRIDQEPQFGTLITDFTMIREGALHRANGGYLVLPAAEVLRNALSWDSLKRSLRNQEVMVEEVAERLGYMATRSLRPEPTPLDVKVVLIGDSSMYQLLYTLDPDFGELFKVKADFDVHMDRNDEHVQNYVSFVCALCREENLRHLDSLALAEVIEYGSRMAGDQEKLSTKFGAIADVLREANYYAQRDDAPYVSDVHVKRAIDERFYRSSLVRDRIQEMIDRGTIMIDVTGDMVGQVNGLSVFGLGDITFGQPSRITASISVGREGLIDIEREANLGGPMHTKGVMILSGYLAQKYAQDKPLSLSARLAFEQSYGGVEGDSASSTELYAMLSALSGLPIKQGIAVTGSVNQRGEVQAIGGVNEKIEGFFAVCQARGLSGEQGVLIPESNVPNLMLKEEVVQAVEQGRFHIWSVSSIEEGIEILTGVKAGLLQADGTFEEGTVNDLANKRLCELAGAMRKYGGASLTSEHG